jgi:hypothetical protein
MKPKTTPTNSGALKPSQRFLIAKSGKLSKTNLIALFASPDLWDSLTALQQLSVLESLNIPDLFGPAHPQKLDSGKYLNYFITPNPTSTRISPAPLSAEKPQAGQQVAVESGGEVFFDLTPHLETFKDDLRAGRFDPKWQREAEEVGLRRKRGDFDGYWEVEVEGAVGVEGRGRVEEVRRRRLQRKAEGLE